MADEKLASKVDPVGEDVENGRKPSVSERALRTFSLSAAGDETATEGQMFSLVGIDPALDAKMHIVNNVNLGSATPESEVGTNGKPGH